MPTGSLTIAKQNHCNIPKASICKNKCVKKITKRYTTNKDCDFGEWGKIESSGKAMTLASRFC